MTQICIRVDEEVKAQAEAVCDELGMSLSTAINIYLKKLGRERRIPFDLSVDTTDRDRQRKTRNTAEEYEITAR
ncbi:MAG: type II toxin-antitoxin system RelB/DinJ family antitoxin [Clostridia bacterium]|nr:type II toxin-antitoxin system RelB/DinJ family antitoxin [Clostridia bacterium]